MEDDAASGEVFWWMVKQKGKAGASAGSAIGELVNFDLLPQFDAVRKYFGLSAFYGISTPEGFFFEFKDINPTEPSN